MPIFEYVCGDCGTRFEKILQHWDDPTDCSKCQSAKVTRQISTFAVGAPSNGGSISAGEACGPCGCGAPRPGMCSMN
jgi:putative FmdB family regulatory protein